MQLSPYQNYADQQKRISSFNSAKVILTNAGIIITLYSLILLGITFTADFKDDIIVTALGICIALTLACFISVFLIKGKLRNLQAEKRYKFKNNLQTD